VTASKRRDRRKGSPGEAAGDDQQKLEIDHFITVTDRLRLFSLLGEIAIFEPDK
jgi:hypothetical protein